MYSDHYIHTGSTVAQLYHILNWINTAPISAACAYVTHMDNIMHGTPLLMHAWAIVLVIMCMHTQLHV